MQAIEVAMPGTNEWKAARPTGIGGSELCAAASHRLPQNYQSRYSQPLKVAMIKLGLLPEFAGNEATFRGQDAESFVLKTFLRQSGLEAVRYPMPMFRHPKWDFIFATPDAILSNGEGCEIKTTLSWIAQNKELWGDEGSDQIPSDYLCQAQLEAEILGVRFVNVVVMAGDWKLKTYRVERNSQVVEGLIDAAHDTWKIIQAYPKTGILPDPLPEHPTTLGLTKALYRTIDPGKIVTLSQEAIDAVARRAAINAEKKRLDEEYESLTAKILGEIGDANAGDLGDGFVMRRKLIPAREVSYRVEPFYEMRRVKMKTFMEGDLDTGYLPTPVNVTRRNAIGDQLEALGYRLKEESASGIRYYIALGKPDVRLADHDTNPSTENWMDREGVREIRFDRSDVEVQNAIKLLSMN